MQIKFTVLGEPQGKGRPKFSRQGGFVKTYTPDKTVLYENLIRTEYLRQSSGQRFADKEPLAMKSGPITVFRPAPARSGRLLWRLGRLGR